jgi:chromosome segregation ATPase
MQEDFNIDDLLSQNNTFHDPKKRAKLLRKIALTQSTQVQTPVTLNDGASQTCGYIKSVRLKNFMCHENFELNFGRRLNFIIGHNGSGKSAILTAISICLGAKATDTNRGSSLKDLIKEGKHTSQIQVVLSNDGIDAFETGKYGKEITIERVLKRDGSGSVPYILKSENGKRVSNKKADLDAILDNFNIAVNNPMSFLSQDAARSFLTASTDDQKYKFFMRGTMMDEILDNLKDTKTQVEKMDLRIIRIRDDINALRLQAKEAKNLLDVLVSSNDLRERQAHLYGKYFYMEADRISETIVNFNNTKIEYEESIQEIEENMTEVQHLIDNFETDRENIEQKIVLAKQQIGEARESQHFLATLLNENVAKAEASYTELKSLETNIKQKEKKIQQCMNEIAQEEQRLKKINGGSKELLIEQVKSLAEEEVRLESQITEKRSELAELTGKLKDQYLEIQVEIDNKRQQINDLQNYIKRSRGNRQDPLANFPPQFKAAMTAIRNARFESPPIGPIGMEMNVKSGFEKWIPAINSILGKDTTTFVVHSYNDQRTLSSILQRANCHSQILIRRPERFDYSNGLPNTSYPTVLDSLNFKNEEIKYVLIDSRHVESMLLVEDRIEAQNIIESRTPNVKAILSLFTASSGFSTSIGMNGGLRVDPINYDTASGYKILPESGSEDTASAVSQVKQLEKEMTQLQNERQNLGNQSNDQKTHLTKELKSLDNELRKANSNKYNLERKLDEDAETGKLEGLQEDLAGYHREIEIYRNTIPDLQESINSYTKESKRGQALLNDADNEYNKFYAAARKLREKSQEIESSKEFNRTKLLNLQKSKGKRETELGRLLEKEPVLQGALQENLEQAAQYATREEADAIHCATLDRVKELIESVNKDVEDANSKLEKSPEDIVNDDAYARSKYHEAAEQFNEIKNTKELMNRSIRERLDAFQESRDYTCISADQDFKSSLQFRNFSGNLDFDFDKGKLKMLVSTKNDKKPRHVDSLSGGEKSFSQIALLLATWKPMRSRIKGLDEFDVFMDQVNRKIGMRLMLKKLSEEHDSQTIFITPQDIGQIAEMDEKFVSIYRMRDPRGTQ